MRDRTENQIKVKITWIRHGMTKANEEHRYLGKTDEPLSETGIRLLEEKSVRERLTFQGYLYASPMKRCVQTAEILFHKKPICVPFWEEMDFGQFEGKNYMDLKDNADYQKWIDSNGTLPFPGGESRKAFIRRSMDGLAWMLSDIREKIKEDAKPAQEQKQNNRQDDCDGETIPVVAVVHGGTIMAVLSELTGGAYFDFQVKNGESYETTLSVLDNVKLIRIQERIK